MTHFACENCGFWQRRHEPPTTCPSCEDFRHPLPETRYSFLTPQQAAGRFTTRIREVLPDVFAYITEPALAIGQWGLVLQTPGGNVHVDGSGWYDDAALEHMRGLGGVRAATVTHFHTIGATWRVSHAFAPETVVHDAELPFCQAFGVTWPFDEPVELVPGLWLHHVGGHTPGSTVVHWPARRLLFCGDALKFRQDAAGRATGISVHKAYDAHIPLTHRDVRRYRNVLEPLDFDGVATPWEVVPAGGKKAAMRLFARQLAGKPFADFMEIDQA